MNIDSIIDQARHGQREAVSTLYEMFVERIFRYIAYRVDSDADAEDLTAEVFVKMVEGLPQYTSTGVPFEAWLYRIASARVIDYRRRSNRRPSTDLSDNLSDEGDSPEDHIQNQEEAEGMRRAFALLNGEQQQVLILRIIERKSHQEVADVMGKSVTAVKSIQHRALQVLAGQLGETKVRHYVRGVKDDD
ncbi:MAG: sigma-70 family RNA polymerase sigma factor [Anaerolineae bacterium]|jgi:RNA polymerase sigma-70 factor (ECF subfamily)|nr:sigma-70 family RNA polymerase sigma factor [Anaerolineae bacterium]